ncbi:hypothetical protein [Sporolactobacillus terrae]|uniref:hypothetical protein n=1 Tax=Sporolactobacillus terrae TaxID=269673 RepID=UPI00111B0199|nr:hypothetical protein [Sporolactobacillus terrae]
MVKLPSDGDALAKVALTLVEEQIKSDILIEILDEKGILKKEKYRSLVDEKMKSDAYFNYVSKLFDMTIDDFKKALKENEIKS